MTDSALLLRLPREQDGRMDDDEEGQAPLGANIDWDSVARYHDAYVRTELDVRFFLQRARAVGGPILEMMCGTGRVTIPLAEAGFPVTAVDSSAGLLARLRSKLAGRDLAVEVVEGDARTVRLGRQFRLVLVAFHSFSELLGPGDRRRAMAALREHLAPGGHLLLTLHNPAVRAAAAHRDWRELGRFALEPGVTLEIATRWEVNGPAQRVHGVQRYRELHDDGRCVKDVSLPITFDLVTLDEALALAWEVGLRLAHVCGDYAGGLYDAVRSPFLILDLVRPDAA